MSRFRWPQFVTASPEINMPAIKLEKTRKAGYGREGEGMNSAISAANCRNLVARTLFFLFCLLIVPLGLAVLPNLAGAAVTASPSSINFSSGKIGGEYTRGITFTNDDAANPVTVNLRISGDSVFTIKGSSSLVIPAGGSAWAEVAFKPALEKNYDATLSVSGAGGASLSISLSGSGFFGINDVIDIRDSSIIAFGPCKVGERMTHPLRLVNTGSMDVTIVKIIPDLYPEAGSENLVFSITTAQGGKLEGRKIPAYSLLDVIVTFTPVEVGRQYSTSVQLLYDNFVKTSEISLSGSGSISSGQIISVANQLYFGNCNLGQSKQASLMFFNNSNYDVKISAVDLPANSVFSCPDLVGKTIPAYGVLDVLVTFKPKSVQYFIDTLRVLYDGWLPESAVTLRGSGTADPELQLAPGILDFGTVGVGQAKSQVLVLTNTGDVAVNILRAESGSNVFQVTGLDGILEVGETRVGTVTFMPVANGRAESVLDLVIDNLANKRIPLSGTGTEILMTPAELNFAGLTVGDSITKEVVVTNCSNQDLEVKGVVTGTSSFQVSGITAGDVIPGQGGSITCQVIFHPETSGYFADNLYINIGKIQEASIPENEIDQGTQYLVHLTGIPYVDFTPTEFTTFTADSNYRLWISAASPQSGRLYVLLAHDPLSAGVIYAVTADGSLQPFPYQSPDAWQSLWYQSSTNPGNILDLSKIDLRQLGCSLCQGPGGNSGQEFHFGNIVIKPPVKDYNNSSDFKYMEGVLYMGTFVKDPYLSQGQPFAFDEGLLEFQILNIRSLAGVWRVTSRYYGVDRVHRNLLSVQEKDGQISATWPPYPVKASYANSEAAYILDFTYGGYHYIYKIGQLTAYSFKGTYSCYYRDQIIEENAPVSGERIR